MELNCKKTSYMSINQYSDIDLPVNHVAQLKALNLDKGGTSLCVFFWL